VNTHDETENPLLRAVLKMFDVAVRGAFDTAATFWSPWSRTGEKQEAPAGQQQSNVPCEQAPRPIKRNQQATMEKKPKAPTKRGQSPKPLAQAATMEKQPKAPTKRSLKQEQELEREERAQKTERLRKLRLAKEAADREKDQR
jgi:hypothetical protein